MNHGEAVTRVAANCAVALFACGILLGITGVARTAVAQSGAVVTFFHGNENSSRFVRWEIDRETGMTQQRELDLALRPGTKMCLEVENPHPVNYRYSLNAVIDTTTPALPDLTAITGFLKSLGPEPMGDAQARNLLVSTPTTGNDKPRDDFLVALKLLAADIETARFHTENSDGPGDPGAGNGGFRHAVKKIGAIGKGVPFRFNDPMLKEHHDILLTRARAWAGQDSLRVMLAGALEVASQTLIATRNRIRTEYSETAAEPRRECHTVVPGRNTITLHIAKVSENGARATFSDKDQDKDPLARIVVDARYERKFVTLDPLTLAAFASDVPEFAVVDDTLRLTRMANPTLARPGMMFTLNPLNFGPADQWGLGFGLGIGFSGKDVVSDLLGGVLLSFRDLVRVGVGFGKSSQPESLKKGSLNERIPADFGELEDAVQNGKLNSKAWYLMLTIPGFTLAR